MLHRFHNCWWPKAGGGSDRCNRVTHIYKVFFFGASLFFPLNDCFYSFFLIGTTFFSTRFKYTIIINWWPTMAMIKGRWILGLLGYCLREDHSSFHWQQLSSYWRHQNCAASGLLELLGNGFHSLKFVTFIGHLL